jgi:glycosyltransferase involved in cell wall biosynthesis
VNNPRYSVIIPVFNRPEEVRDLLESLATQTRKDFEVIVVEDGSTVTCEDVVLLYANTFPVEYYYKSNSGPGPSRNFGFTHARGEYFVVFDSDCILPSNYFESVDDALKSQLLDVWGGPDRAHEKFTLRQQAMAYTMSSFLTTGGIRGGKKRLGWFQPRSFNMGISRKVFEVTKGFQFDRFAEDIELSIRMKKAGFNIGLIPEAFVFHKRRASFLQFFKQVFNFGKGRALIGAVHPHEVKVTHWFPAVFTLGTLLIPVLALIYFPLFAIGAGLFALYLIAVFFHALWLTRRVSLAALSVHAALLQLWGYGLGFLIQKIRQLRPASKK